MKAMVLIAWKTKIGKALSWIWESRRSDRKNAVQSRRNWLCLLPLIGRLSLPEILFVDANLLSAVRFLVKTSRKLLGLKVSFNDVNLLLVKMFHVKAPCLLAGRLISKTHS